MIDQSLKMLATKWSHFPDVGTVRPIDAGDLKVLLEIRDVLERYGMTDRFGVSLVHRHFHINQDEVLFESTDVANRRQMMEVRKATEVLDGGKVLETQWVFDGNGGNIVCVGYCHYSQGHKHYHSQK